MFNRYFKLQTAQALALAVVIGHAMVPMRIPATIAGWWSMLGAILVTYYNDVVTRRFRTGLPDEDGGPSEPVSFGCMVFGMGSAMVLATVVHPGVAGAFGIVMWLAATHTADR